MTKSPDALFLRPESGDIMSNYNSKYLKNYRRNNPEKQEQWRTTSEIRHLESKGYTVRKKRNPEDMTLEELEAFFEKERQASKKWKNAHKEELKAYHKKWRGEHQEELREYNRKWRAKNQERVKEYNRKWREANPDYWKIRNKRYLDALEKARKEQQKRIREDIRKHKEQEGARENEQ